MIRVSLLSLSLVLWGSVCQAQTLLDLATAQPPVDLVLPYGSPVVIQDVSVACSSPDQTAIRIQFPEAPSVAVLTVAIRNVTILPGCARGIWLTNAWNAQIQHVTVWGRSTEPMLTAIQLDGRSNDVSIRDAHTFYTQTAVLITDRVESPHIADSAFIQTVDGIVVDTEHVIPERPGLFLRDNHIAATRRGISVSWHPQGFVSGQLIYRVGNDPNFVGIELGTRAADVLLTGNTIQCGTGAGTRAVTFGPLTGRSNQVLLNSVYCSNAVTR